jgi:two-component system phosphate regulon sensor histidine kinase PhoR
VPPRQVAFAVFGSCQSTGSPESTQPLVTIPTALDVSLLNLVAHEMRAPLSVLRGYLSLLRDGSLPDSDEALRVMEAKAEELEGLAEILVMAARLESAAMPWQSSVFDVAEAVTTAVESLQPRIRLEQAQIDVLPTSGPMRVAADRSHVVRILGNLLNNSLTYGSRPALIAVEIRETSPVEIAVYDNGIGIEPEWHGRIFERFSRYGDGGQDRASGLGLGLSISRDLAELNGGELLLERSAPGKGSVFVLRLSLAPAGVTD